MQNGPPDPPSAAPPEGAPTPEDDLDELLELDLSRWRDYPDLISDSLWLLGARDASGGHSAEYWGNFVPQIPHQIMRRFTLRRETVLDLFSGLGTTLLESRRLGRHCLGVELNAEAAARSRDLVGAAPNPFRVDAEVIAADSAAAAGRAAVERWLGERGRTHADCVLLHPPYHDIIRFGDDPRDLSNAPTHAAFLERFRAVVRNAHHLLRPGRTMALIIGDRYADGEWVPLGFDCMRVCRDEGFVLKAICVKDIQGNERGKGKATNLWRYRALKSGTYVFRHEYVMVFRKGR